MTTKAKTYGTLASAFDAAVVAANKLIDASTAAQGKVVNSKLGKAAKKASAAKQLGIGKALCGALAVEKATGAMSGQTTEALKNKDAFNASFDALSVGDDTKRVYRRIVICPAILAHVPLDGTPEEVSEALAKVEWNTVTPKGNPKKVKGVGDTPSKMRKFVEAHTEKKRFADIVVDAAITFLAAEKSKGAAGMAGHIDAIRMSVDSVIGIKVCEAFQAMHETDALELDALDGDLPPDLPAPDLGSASEDNNRQATGS